MDASVKTEQCLLLKSVVVALTLCVSCISDAGAQSAANYPSRPIRYLVGYTPAGTADLLARAVGQKLTEAWGQQVIVENRPGGGTNIATELAAKSAPDGYTLFMPTVANAIKATLIAKMNFDLMRDFIHITNYAKVPGIVVVHPSVPAIHRNNSPRFSERSW